MTFSNAPIIDNRLDSLVILEIGGLFFRLGLLVPCSLHFCESSKIIARYGLSICICPYLHVWSSWIPHFATFIFFFWPAHILFNVLHIVTIYTRGHTLQSGVFSNLWSSWDESFPRHIGNCVRSSGR